MVEDNNSLKNKSDEEEKKSILIFNGPAIRSESFINSINVLQDDPEFEVTNCDYVDEIIQTCSFSPCMMIFAAVTSKADVMEIVKMLTKLKGFIKQNFVKVLLFNYVKSNKVEQLFRKHGVGDFLDDNINQKSLSYKINLMMRAIQNNYKRYTDKIKTDKEVTTFTSNTDPFSILKFIKPINQQFEIWGIENKKKLTFFNNTWQMEVAGPNGKFGKWKEDGGESELKKWKWIFHEETLQDEFSPDGTWVFEGKKPEFQTASADWKFTSKAPNFYFDSEIVTTYKIEFDEENMIIAKDSRMLFTNLSQFKTLISLMEDPEASAEDIKSLLTGKNQIEEETHQKGEANGTDHLSDKEIGSSEGGADQISDHQSGEVEGGADHIDDFMKGDVAKEDSLDDDLHKMLGDADDVGGYLKGDVDEMNISDGAMLGEVEEVDLDKGKLMGDVSSEVDTNKGLMTGKSEDAISDINNDDLRAGLDEEFLSDTMSGEIGPGLEVRNKHDVNTERKLKESEELAKKNQMMANEEKEKDALRAKLDSAELSDLSNESNFSEDNIDGNMSGDGESADHMSSYWADPNHAFDEGEKQQNEWGGSVSGEVPKKGEIGGKGQADKINNNMEGSGESADEIDNFWRDPLHQQDSQDKTYNKRDKEVEEINEDTPDFPIEEDEPLKKKKKFVKNHKGNWVTEEELVDELKEEEGMVEKKETPDNILEFSKKSVDADTQNIEMNLSIMKTGEDETLILLSTDKLELTDMFDNYLIMKDDGSDYQISEDEIQINLELYYQENVVKYKLIAHLEDIYKDRQGMNNLTFGVIDGQQEELDQINDVYEKRQQAIISFFDQAKGVA